jgi:hypothetical protein
MVLTMLSEQPSRTMRMSDLAALTNGSLYRLSHVARRLERKAQSNPPPIFSSR